MKNFKIVKHAIVLMFICSLAWLFLYIIGHFISLHPNAYRDLIRSILLGYGIYILVYSLYTVIYKRISLVRVRRRFSIWWENETPIEAICGSFTIITAINSIMMLMGYDTPKQGVFAYIHMMSRLFIISCIILIWMWKDVIQRAKKFTFKNNIRNFYQEVHKHIFASVSKLFTIITTAYCILMIVFYRIIDPGGGMVFYQILLGILVIITIYLLVVRISRK